MDCYGGQQSDDKQWGTYETAKASEKLITITFPVSFAAAAYSVALGHKGFSNWTNGANVNYVNKTVSDMTVYYCDGYGFSWLAIGMQQWGVNIGNSSGVEYSFPVSFTSKLYTALATPCIKYEFWTNPATIVVKSLTKYKVGAYDLQSGQIWWLAIGV